MHPEINLENLYNSIPKYEYQRECIPEKQAPENNQQRFNNIKEVLPQTSKEETLHVKKRFL